MFHSIFPKRLCIHVCKHVFATTNKLIGIMVTKIVCISQSLFKVFTKPFLTTPITI